MCKLMLTCPPTLFCNLDDAKTHVSHQPIKSSRRKCTCKKTYVSSSSSSSSLSSRRFPVRLTPDSTKENIFPPTAEEEQFYSCSSEDSESDDKPQEMQSSDKRAKAYKIFDILNLIHEFVDLIKNNYTIPEAGKPAAQATPSTCSQAAMKVASKDTILEPTLTPNPTPLVWPPHNCLCCVYGRASAPPMVPPFFKPYNLASSDADLQIPKPFVYKEINSFKECCAANAGVSLVDQSPVSSFSTATECSEYDINIPCSYPIKTSIIELDPRKQDVISKEEEFHTPATLERQTDMEEYVDEELHPRYVDKIFTEPFDVYKPSPDILLEYDDEEPMFAEYTEYIDEEIHPVFAEAKIDPSELYESCLDCLVKYDDEDPSSPDMTSNAIETKAETNTDSKTSIPTPAASDDDKSPRIKQEPMDETSSIGSEIIDNQIEAISEPILLFEEKTSYQIAYATPATGQHDSRKLIKYKGSEEEYEELAKERIAESRKRKHDNIVQSPSKDMTLATLHQFQGLDPPSEMKFFIDSLIMDLDAMDFARRKSQFEKNTFKPKIALGGRDSFPVTITSVTDLGANSLYVKWTIHDCFGISGYEIYTDGYLTNRYYNSRHEAAVVTHVDITLPHKIVLVAQPWAHDENIESFGYMTTDKNKTKSLLWKADADKERRSYSALWTPSIFLYDPTTSAATAAPPIMRDIF